MSRLRTDAIYYAITSLERECNFRWNVGGRDNLDRYRELQHAMKEALAEYRQLTEALPRLQDFKAEADRAYDKYVTRGPEGCSCHINPPCSYCTSGAGEEE